MYLFLKLANISVFPSAKVERPLQYEQKITMISHAAETSKPNFGINHIPE